MNVEDLEKEIARETELDVQAILHSPSIQSDEIAFAAVLARAARQAGPRPLEQENE